MKTKYQSTQLIAAARNRDRILSSACAIRGRWLAVALRGFLFTSIRALSVSPMEAQCNQWNVGHGWRFKQGTRVINQKTVTTAVDMNLQQKGTVVTGTATLRDTYPSEGVVYVLWNVSGTVDGTVEGDSFAVKIYWENNTIGVYDGTIRPSGRIEGKGYEQATPRKKVNWYSVSTMKCADTAPAAPPPLNSPGKVPAPTPKPIKSSGKAKVSAATPTIKAFPIAVTIPEGQSHGRTTLTWDGGPDHPDAEVWRKEGVDGEETLVVQQGKGTRSVTVELGKNYQFLLKDAGQQIAKAVVLTKH
jgi:hypothetical protein